MFDRTDKVDAASGATHNALQAEAMNHLSSPKQATNSERHHAGVGTSLFWAAVGAGELYLGARCPAAVPGLAMLTAGVVTESLSLPDLIRGLDKHFGQE